MARALEAAVLSARLRAAWWRRGMPQSQTAYVAVALVALIVVVESARRNIPVEFAARKLGDRLLSAISSVLPIKVNRAMLLTPATGAPWLWSLPPVFARPRFRPRPG